MMLVSFLQGTTTGSGGQNSDEASVGAGSYEVTLRPDRSPGSCEHCSTERTLAAALALGDKDTALSHPHVVQVEARHDHFSGRYCSVQGTFCDMRPTTGCLTGETQKLTGLLPQDGPMCRLGFSEAPSARLSHPDPH
jgi:hypothetical protein